MSVRERSAALNANVAAWQSHISTDHSSGYALHLRSLLKIWLWRKQQRDCHAMQLFLLAVSLP
jgi:hypothetical protein